MQQNKRQLTAYVENHLWGEDAVVWVRVPAYPSGLQPAAAREAERSSVWQGLCSRSAP